MSSVRRLTTLRSLAVSCALGSSALLLTACTNADTTRSSVAEAAQTESPSGSASASPSGSTSPSASQSLTEDQADRKALVPMAKVSWDKAAGTAVKEVSGGKLVEMELKRAPAMASASAGSASPSMASPMPSQGSPVWENKVATSDGTLHLVWVDAVSGKVLRSQTDPDQDADDKSEWSDRLSKAKQTPQQAVQAAMGRAKGTVTAAKLDEDDQQLMWAVDIVSTDTWDKATVDVDATNGKVLREDVDTD
ncbi:PepSY domain-containing protein [Streptomyces sp. NPDC048182]|uniref:PepSY domain-containing protein n=1 Tax=unclassified Streptomyces TaxID=2593676 RepID=UPI0033AB4C68